jgi:hypothetical protein
MASRPRCCRAHERCHGRFLCRLPDETNESLADLDVVLVKLWRHLGGAETVLGITNRFAAPPGKRGVYGLSGASTAPRAATAVG